MTQQKTIQKKPQKRKTTNKYIELDDDDLIVTLTGKTTNLRDEINLEIDKLESWFLEIIKQTEANYKKKDDCLVCGAKPEPKLLESNHIAGEKHDYRKETLCVECHREFTEVQMTWSPKWYKYEQPEPVRRLFLYMGIRDILVLKSKKTGNSIYEKFSRKLNSVISTLIIQENERENSD